MTLSGRQGKSDASKAMMLLAIGIASGALFLLRAPRTFDPEGCQVTAAADRTPMARDFIARGDWHAASQETLVACLGEPDDASSHPSWLIPERLVHDMRPAGTDSQRVIDRARLVAVTSPWGFKLLIDTGVRGTARKTLASAYDPDGFAWSLPISSRPAWPTCQLVAAIVRAASEEITDLSWYAGDGGWLHDSAFLRVRLVDDRAVSAWLALH